MVTAGLCFLSHYGFVVCNNYARRKVKNYTNQTVVESLLITYTKRY